jgi:serine/threonine protein kinase
VPQGEVFLGIKDGAQFAIKALTKLKKGGLGKPGAKGASTFDSAKAEIATLKKIQHPNCVHLFDVIFDHTHGQVFLVLEYVDGGVSQKTLPNGDLQLLPERVIWSHLRHFVMGLEYLHMHGIVHRCAASQPAERARATRDVRACRPAD